MLMLAGCLFATEKTFVHEYTYQASDYDSKETSRANALEQIKTILLEEVSIFFQSELEMKDWEKQIGDNIESVEFVEQIILAIMAGVTETNILEEKWADGEYWIKAELTLDPDDIKRKINKIVKNKSKLKELEDVKKKANGALAEIERQKKELEKAEPGSDQNMLTEAYNKETDVLSATDWFQKGYNATINEEWVKAISFFLKVVEIEPDYAMAYNNLGYNYGKQGNNTKAIELLEQSIELDPNNASAYMNLGIAYEVRSILGKAILMLEKAIEIEPDYAMAYYNLGIAYRMQEIGRAPV